MVNWCERVCRAAARHRIMVNFHGSFKSTGAERTWPNMITREAVRGNEMNIFNKTVTPRHCATLPFTRFLLGPADFTPGGFGNVYSKDFVPQVKKGHRYGDETDRCPHWAEEMGRSVIAARTASRRCVGFRRRGKRRVPSQENAGSSMRSSARRMTEGSTSPRRPSTPGRLNCRSTFSATGNGR